MVYGYDVPRRGSLEQQRQRSGRSRLCECEQRVIELEHELRGSACKQQINHSSGISIREIEKS